MRDGRKLDREEREENISNYWIFFIIGQKLPVIEQFRSKYKYLGTEERLEEWFRGGGGGYSSCWPKERGKKIIC